VTAGGPGTANSISGSPVTYAAGGNGGARLSNPPGTAGGANTGTGGGAGPGDTGTVSGGSAGGSGIIVIRAPGSANLGASPGTNTVTTLPAPAGGCKVATFTVSGTLTT
jgi:hypothetical protein